LMDGVEILCSNIQSYRFCLGLQSTLDAESLMKIILENSKTVSHLSRIPVNQLI